MKVAFTASGNTLDSPIDGRFGRARYFMIVDTEDGSVEAVSNEQNLQAPSGAGVQAAQNVADSGAKALVTKHCGPKAFSVLSRAGIEVYGTDAGTVAKARELFEAGRLERIDSPDVEGHWA